ncbi:MAG: arginine--tRNA ligase [Gammaproteobacteria bacterium]|nr:arginine--tRNA ligase [Gammaproteobacteria bacterium]
MNVFQLVQDRFRQAIVKIDGVEQNAPAPLARSSRPEFGEYQFNGAMALAKMLKSNPRQIATQIVELVNLDDVAESLDIAGPGFINVKLKPEWLSEQVAASLTSESLGVEKEQAKTVVVDLSSPNLAKEMHVGHLRSTIIGDAVANVIEFLGHKVIRQNHMGDWGTQFGMLIAHLQDKLQASEVATTALSDLEDFYRQAKIRFDEEEGFADRARQYVVKLQGGDPECETLWKKFIDVSIQHSEEVYEKLNVNLKRSDIMGESAYNPMLPGVVADLKEQGIVVEDQGAQVVFLEELANKDGEPAVYIVEKSGGGYLYSTTDLAAMKYRSFDLNADRIIIFTDARQAFHFKQAELVGRKGGLIKDETSYEHGPFGMMLGQDGKPFKTRTGGTIKLVDLLDESVERAGKLLAERDSDLSAEEQQEVARKVGIGAIKYADLSKNRTTDYIFNWDTMLSFEGDTAPYLQYAYTRIKSIFRKSGVDAESLNADLKITEAQEKALAVKLLQFNEAILTVSVNSTPHVLCSYLYELSSSFMSFYEACPMLKEGVAEDVKLSRLAISLLTAKTLKKGLDLLGIETMERM